MNSIQELVQEVQRLMRSRAFSTPIIFSPVGDQLYLDPAVLKAASSRKLEKVEARLRSSKYNLFN